MSDRPIDVVLGRLKEVRSSGDSGRQWTSRCPAHDDNQSSLGVGLADSGAVLLKCYANCTTVDIAHAIDLELRDLFPGREEKASPASGVTVARLAFEKRLSGDWLKSYCGLRDVGGPDARRVEIPYRDEQGNETATRVRSALRAKDGSRWKVRGEKPTLYGLWRLAEFKARGGAVVLVEGETDCWALWAHGFNALGVPGASATNVLGNGSVLSGFDPVVIWREPDKAGAGFANEVAGRLQSSGFTGRVLVASADGVKDPADLQAKQGEKFPTAFGAVLAAAVPAVVTAAPSGPLPQTVRRVESLLRQTGVCDWGMFEMTDSGNAGRLEHLHGNDLRYVAAWERWYCWDGRRWAPDETLEVYRRADRATLSLPLEAQLSPGATGTNDCLNWFTKSQSRRSVEATISLARSVGRIPVSHERFDRQPMVLNCPNGSVCLTSGKASPHRRDDLITVLCPTEYDSAAQCPTWERFLAAIFPADPSDPARGGNARLIVYVQKLLGYCLSGVVLANLLPIFWGGGSNGKSTLLDVVQDVVGPNYSMQAPTGLLMARHGESHPTELADLFGKRLVVATETGQNRRLDEALVKQLTGGDKIRARRMRENFWEFSPTHKLILCTNHRPQVRGNDHGIWRRLLLVPFLVRFWDPDKKEPGPEHLRQDKALKAKLREEARGILAWLVRGCLAWQAEGLEQPDDVRATTEEYRQEEDVLGQFMGERYRKMVGAKVLLKDVHNDYVKWSNENGDRPVAIRTFAAELRTRGFELKVGTQNKVRIHDLAPLETESAHFDADSFD